MAFASVAGMARMMPRAAHALLAPTAGAVLAGPAFVVVLLALLALAATVHLARKTRRARGDASGMPTATTRPAHQPVAPHAGWLLPDAEPLAPMSPHGPRALGLAGASLLSAMPEQAAAWQAPGLARHLIEADARAGTRPKRTRPLRIAMMGSRGIPASYSGFETCVEQLSVRLVERGHQVTVYCRSHHVKWPGKTYKGVRLVKLPTIPSKHFDTIVHTFLSLLHGLPRRYDVVYICGVGNAPLSFIPRLAGRPAVVNVDGADWQRDKWGGFAKRYLRMAERAATRFPTLIIADSRVVERYYLDRFHKSSIFIPYGSDVPRRAPGETLERLGLSPDDYLLWVGRLVPENNAHDVVAAYQRLGGPATGLRLCIVGDAPYASDYIDNLKATAGPGVIFAGYVFGDGYHELGSNARVFVFASGVGGTHPALLEAMAFGNCVVVNDMAANVETVGDAAVPYDGAAGAGDLTRVLGAVLADPALIARYRQRAAERAATVYSWEAITDQYEELFGRLTQQRSVSGPGDAIPAP